MGFSTEKPPPSTLQSLSGETPAAPDWVPPVEWLNDLGGSLPDPIEFTDRDIRLIVKSLPPGVEQQRIEILPLLLREWARVDLRWHSVNTPLPALAKRRKALEKIAERAAALIEELDALDGFGRWELVEQFGMAEGLPLLTAVRNHKRRVEEWRYLTAVMAAGAVPSQRRPSKGQPRNQIAALVLMDLAALFSYVTGKRAARNVPTTGQDAGKESGPFLEFARAMWPVIFRNGDYGLLSQLEVWSADGTACVETGRDFAALADSA
jgi:hypothetical protein